MKGGGVKRAAGSKGWRLESELPPSGSLALELRPALDQLLVLAERLIVLRADILPQARAVAEHHRGAIGPRLGQHLRIFHHRFVVDLIFADARVTLHDVQSFAVEGAGAQQ